MSVNWQKALLDAGGPLLKSLIEKGVGGGIKGKIAGSIADSVLKSLGEAFNVDPTPEAIGTAIEKDPVGAPVIVQSLEDQYRNVLEIGAGDLTKYLELLKDDQKAEGLLTRLWRPLFAIGFTLTYMAIGLTIVWLALTGQNTTIQSLLSLVTFLTFYIVAGCAVLGVQVYQRSEEKKQGVQ